jgi:hypothetical protein
MDDIVDNNEVGASFKEALRRRLITPVYGYFTLTWILLHWEAIYITLFVNEERFIRKTGLLKNEFLRENFFDLKDPSFWFTSFVLPSIITALTIWVLPKYITIPAFRKEEQDKTEKRKIVIAEQKKFEEDKVKILEVVETRKKKEKEVKEQEKKIKEIDPTSEWQEEFEEFRITSFYDKYKFIIDSVYKNNGKIRVTNLYNDPIFEIPESILVYSHTNNLITLDKTKETIELTEKGKYFVKQFSLENSRVDNLKIIKATYGSGETFLDITDQLNKLVNKGKLKIVLNNDIAGDPTPGSVKVGKIKYELNGKIFEKDYTENDTVELL